MTPAEHYVEAERFRQRAQKSPPGHYLEGRSLRLALLHATLALYDGDTASLPQPGIPEVDLLQVDLQHPEKRFWHCKGNCYNAPGSLEHCREVCGGMPDDAEDIRSNDLPALLISMSDCTDLPAWARALAARAAREVGR